MSTPHKAKPADWAWLEGNSTVDRCDAAWSRGLIELRARVEALEAAEQHQDKLDRLIAQDRAAMMVEGTFEHGGETYRFKGRPEREAAMNELRAASAEARPAVKAPITRDRDETGDYLIIHDASPSTGSLVERVATAIDAAPYDEDRHQWDEARAAIREVATWLRDRGGYPWAWVAQMLEQEADR